MKYPLPEEKMITSAKMLQSSGTYSPPPTYQLKPQTHSSSTTSTGTEYWTIIDAELISQTAYRHMTAADKRNPALRPGSFAGLCWFKFLPDPLINLLSMHRNGLWCIDTNSHLIAFYTKHSDFNFIANADCFSSSSGQNQHVSFLLAVNEN